MTANKWQESTVEVSQIMAKNYYTIKYSFFSLAVCHTVDINDCNDCNSRADCGVILSSTNTPICNCYSDCYTYGDCCTDVPLLDNCISTLHWCEKITHKVTEARGKHTIFAPLFETHPYFRKVTPRTSFKLQWLKGCCYFCVIISAYSGGYVL